MEQGNDPVNYGRRDSDLEVRTMRNFQSARLIMEGLILAGIIWLGSSVQEQAKATVALQTQVANMNAQLGSVPELSRIQAQNLIRLDDHERRINSLEVRTQR